MSKSSIARRLYRHGVQERWRAFGGSIRPLFGKRSDALGVEREGMGELGSGPADEGCGRGYRRAARGHKRKARTRRAASLHAWHGPLLNFRARPAPLMTRSRRSSKVSNWPNGPAAIRWMPVYTACVATSWPNVTLPPPRPLTVCASLANRAHERSNSRRRRRWRSSINRCAAPPRPRRPRASARRFSPRPEFPEIEEAQGLLFASRHNGDPARTGNVAHIQASHRKGSCDTQLRKPVSVAEGV